MCDSSLPTTVLVPEKQLNPRDLRFKLSSHSLILQTQVSPSDARHDRGNLIPCSTGDIDPQVSEACSCTMKSDKFIAAGQGDGSVGKNHL